MSAIFSTDGAFLSYFAPDGSYGEAEGMVVINTAEWGNEEWDLIGECGDYSRGYVAELLDNGATVEEARAILEKEEDEMFLLAEHDLKTFRENNA